MTDYIYLNQTSLAKAFCLNIYSQSLKDELTELGIKISEGEIVDKEQLIRLSNIVFNG